MRRDKHEVTPQLVDQLVKAGITTENDYKNRPLWYEKMFDIAGVDGIAYTSEIVDIAREPFFQIPEMTTELKEVISSAEAKELIKNFRDGIEKLDAVNEENVMALIKSLQTETIKGRDLWNPLRVATTRAVQGPNLPQIIELMGKDWTLKNIDSLN
jgi:nondiscriminating glutamyl-tRNA synthetase